MMLDGNSKLEQQMHDVLAIIAENKLPQELYEELVKLLERILKKLQ